MMGGSPGSPGTTDDKKGVKREPLRAAIACQRCRKSKVKCINTGGVSPCGRCIQTGNECTYPEATPTPAKRLEPQAGARTEQGSERKRLKKSDDTTKTEGDIPAAIYAEVLSAPYLTETVWSQVFDIYRVHFATELPFLHLATLKEKINSKFKAKQNDTSPDINLVLLGILTLTARFSPTLVSYITAPRTGPAASALPKSKTTAQSQDASAASEYYAEVLNRAIGDLRTGMETASVERVQAFLMLGLYEWSQARPKVGGMAAWMYVGVAIRMAQALGLGEGDREQEKSFNSPATIAPKAPTTQSQSQLMIAKEIRRRTMFSCLILDRLLGCGKGRVSTIRSEDLHIQLPSSEVAFDLSEDVYTGFLKPTSDDKPRAPINDSCLSRFVRLIDIWGEISKWSFAGGRFTEKTAPWMPKSAFYQLRDKLDSFYAELPDQFQWSTSNYYKHENHQASGVYVSMHMLGAVCRIMLHREYIPFIPIRCDKPVGPLDEPTFPAGSEPHGFWDESAEHVFHAAKDIVELIEICRDKLPMSALVLFAVWTAAFVGIYAVSFPHMDAKRHMLPSDEEAAQEPSVSQCGATGVTFKTLQQMSTWLKMAGVYVRYFREMVCYYRMVKKDYDKYTRGGGGGLEEWKNQGLKIVNNGEIFPRDDDACTSSRDSTVEPGSSNGPDGSYHAEHSKTPGSGSMSFTPINSAHHQPREPDGLPSHQDHISNHWRLHSSSHTQQQQQSPAQLYASPSPQLKQQPSPDSYMHTNISFHNVPVYDSADQIAEFLGQTESMSWSLAPGGINQFAHGTEDLLPMESGNGYWGPMTDGFLQQQVGSYS